MPPRVVYLHAAAARVPEWVRHVPVTSIALHPSSNAETLRAALHEDVECIIIDGDTGDPMTAARLVHTIDPNVQVVLSVGPETRRAVERAMLFAPGVGELWLASRQDVMGGLPERAAGVTRQRRKFQRTRERVEHERFLESPQRTERALISDAYLAALVHVLPEAVFSVDERGRVLSANPAVATVLGRPEHTVVGQTLADVLAPDSDGQLRDVLTPAVGQSARTDLRFRRATGRDGWGELIMAPVTTGATRVWVVILHDLTEREEDRERLREQAWELEQRVEESQALTEELEQSNAQLREAMVAVEQARAEAEAANRSKMNFLAAMSHELRTPLNAIAGYVQLLEAGIRGPITDEQRADLERIKRSERYLLSLVNDVLNFAKLETGAVAIRVIDAPVDAMLRGIEDLIAPQVQARGLTYHYESCNPTIAVHADPEKVQQVLLNLLGNAIKFTEPGGHITVACDVQKETVAIRVRDTGSGIPRDKLETIFEPFVQVDRRLNNPGEGTGLGLAISRDLARAMHGDVTAESELGEGATFTLTLPRSRTEPALRDMQGRRV